MCAKLPTDHFHCRLCGYDTPLQKDAMFMAYANCPTCGKRAWYRTNAGKERILRICPFFEPVCDFPLRGYKFTPGRPPGLVFSVRKRTGLTHR